MSYLYIIQARNKPAGPIKIGFSKKPAIRLKQLQTGNPERLHVLVVRPTTDSNSAPELLLTVILGLNIAARGGASRAELAAMLSSVHAQIDRWRI